MCVLYRVIQLGGGGGWYGGSVKVCNCKEGLTVLLQCSIYCKLAGLSMLLRAKWSDSVCAYPQAVSKWECAHYIPLPSENRHTGYILNGVLPYYSSTWRMYAINGELLCLLKCLKCCILQCCMLDLSFHFECAISTDSRILYKIYDNQLTCIIVR